MKENKPSSGKPSKDKNDYENLYEFRKQWISAFEREQEDERYYPCISFFCKSGTTPVSGKIFQPPSPDFKCECDIKECFTKIKEKMHTKGGQLRATMLKLVDYEVQSWSQLLEYLRSEWQLGNRGKVILTGSEWFMLFGVKKKK